MINWGEEMLRVANDQEHNQQTYGFLKDKMKALIADGVKATDDSCGKIFKNFVILTAWHQYRLGMHSNKDIYIWGQPEDYLIFENVIVGLEAGHEVSNHR